MSAPIVACVMLVNGRPEMVRRAYRCFDAQTYSNKVAILSENDGSQPIGTLRNQANGTTSADIIVHWDSDDWSHPNRIAEQVALLQSSGAECVGYGQMMFYSTVRFCDCYKSPGHPWYASRCRKPHGHVGDHEFGTEEEAYERFYSDKPKQIAMIKSELQSGAHSFGDAWIYTASIPKYVLGTSMCYWHKTWEAHLFPDYSEGCDDLFWFNKGVKIEAVSAISESEKLCMIASVHTGNTCAAIMRNVREWQRVPEWDAYCRDAMKL
jgi:glycosyltransferase involved in cell wall biosynthesis